MDSLLNKVIYIHFKNSKSCLFGTLINFDDNYVYLQSNSILIIPVKNIMYFSMNSEEGRVEEPQEKQEKFINVFVNGEFLTKIQIADDISILNANDNLLKIVYANEDVQKALYNKVQKTLEYSPGEINIILSNDAEDNKKVVDESFSMDGVGNPLSNYLTPSQMVSRLTNIKKKKEIKNE